MSGTRKDGGAGEERELDVLFALSKAPDGLYNGTLGAVTGLSYRSRVFARLRSRGLIEGHPYRITEAGSAFLAERERQP